MKQPDALRFILNDQEMHLGQCGPEDTLLDYLRDVQRLTGTKEGCAEGDCGACTVLVGKLENGLLRHAPVNACIRLLPSLHRCHVVTIEHLRGAPGHLHPVQQSMIDHHGSQCGFCTPGFVMALYALWLQNPNPNRNDIIEALQGNLCRCTGYAPIIRAAEAMGSYDLLPQADPVARERDQITKQLQAIPDQSAHFEKDGARSFWPRDLEAFAAYYHAHPDATVVAGATNIGLWITKDLRRIGPAIFIAHLEELKTTQDLGDHIYLGAGLSYSDAREFICSHFPQLASYWTRIAGWQIRNMGSLGGNIANGSPIGDLPPIFIALNAQLHLRRGEIRRSCALRDFFLAYGKQDRAPGEFIEAITLPKLPQNVHFAAYKISKRRDEDIATLSAGLYCETHENRITSARLAYGGMAGIPKRARNAEARLQGAVFERQSFKAAAEALAKDFTPLDDLRASADYRQTVAGHLLERFYLEISNEGTIDTQVERGLI